MDINSAIQLASKYHQQGNLQQAEIIYKEIINLQPNNLYVIQKLANISQDKGQIDEAIVYYQKAINLNPGDFGFYYNLANAFLEKGEIEQAILNYKETLRINPNFHWAYNNLGLTLKDIGQVDEAITHFQKAIELSPNFAFAINNLGNALQNKGQIDNAISLFQKTLQINPNNFESLNNLGNCLKDKGLIDEAITCYQRAIEINPTFADSFNNLGVTLQSQGQLDEAFAFYQKALQINPNNLESYCNIGTVMHEKGQPDEAFAFYQKALQINPNYANAHLNMAYFLLLLGNFKQGWKEFEWRWKTKEYLKNSCFHRPVNFTQPILNRLDITGHTVLIYAEQGLGDEIQFIRYAPLVAQHGTKVIIECHKEISTLLRTIEGVEQFIVQGEPLPHFDIQCPILTLPLVFNTTPENIPVNIPYISVNSILIQKWKDKIQHDNSKLKVGIVWHGNPKHKNDRNRSMPFAHFSPFAKFTDITFYSLQKGKASEQARNFSMGMKFIDLTEEINDFSDTAALIENLDLTMSVDTSVVHLAGALGKPIWTLLPFAPDWRWMLNREDSPWYPTMRLFRQPSPGDWNSVIKKVSEELQELVSSKA
jgi:tetratricopeptide (TPR) repeat protein